MGHHNYPHHVGTQIHTQPGLEEGDRFIPAEVKQAVTSEGGVSPGFRVEISFDEPKDIISEPSTNSVDQPSESESILSTTQKKLVEQITEQKLQQTNEINNIVNTDRVGEITSTIPTEKTSDIPSTAFT